MPSKLTGFRREAAEQEQPQRSDVDSTTIIGNANHAQLSFVARPSSRNSSNQGSILDPSPLYALSLHKVTRGYEYSGPVFPAPQGPRHRLGNIRLIAHDPEDERATSLLGAATRNLDLVDLSKATPEQTQQLQLQSRIILSHETLRSTVAGSHHQYSHEKEFSATSQERKFAKDFKMVVVGAGVVDKSALVIQFLQSQFINRCDLTMEDICRKSTTIDGIPAVVEVSDTTGLEEYITMREQYMRMSEGFVLVYSITSRESFANIFDLYEETSRVRKTKAWPRVLVANHCERESERQSSGREGKLTAKQFDCPFLEASSTTRVNVDNVFEAVIREIRYHDAMGTANVKRLVHSGGPALNVPRSRRSIQDDILDRVDETPEPIDQLLREEAKSKRSNNYFGRRLKRPAE
jgi:GTPase KRas protein